MKLLMDLFPFYQHSQVKLLITYVSSFKGKEGYKENIKLSNDKKWGRSKEKRNEKKYLYVQKW